MRLLVFCLLLLFSCKNRNKDLEPQAKCGVNSVSIFDGEKTRCSIVDEGSFVFDNISVLHHSYSHKTDSLGVLYIEFDNKKMTGIFPMKKAYVEYHPNNVYYLQKDGVIEISRVGNLIKGTYKGNFKNYQDIIKDFKGEFELEIK